MGNLGLIVLTNDDGIDAPGLAALRAATEGIGRRVVVAPLEPQSGCGHKVTTHRHFAVADRPDGSIAVAGTPADCARIALHRFGPAVDWVVAGINAGGNLGMDIHHSGTVAAVREAASRGIPGVAISHYIARGRAIDWDRAARWARRVLDRLLCEPPGPGHYWNVNLPHPEPGGPDPAIVDCPADHSPLPLDFRVEAEGHFYSGNYQARPRRPGGDVDVCFGGQIAVSRVAILAGV